MPPDVNSFYNSYKNTLLEVAKNSNLPLSKFRTKTNGFKYAIEILDTPLIFIVEQRTIYEMGTHFSVFYSEIKPDFPLSKNRMPSVSNKNIDGVSKLFRRWLSYNIKQYFELTALDEWEELQLAQPMLSTKSFTKEDFKKFTEPEKEQIRVSLSEYSRILEEELKPVKEDLEFIKERLDYLGNSLDRLNKFDWKGVSVSTIIGIITNMSIDQTTAARLYALFQQAMTGIGLLE